MVYEQQYSFSTLGDDGIQVLRQIRNELAEAEKKPLSQIYTRFGIARLTAPGNADTLSSVGVIQVSKHKSQPYAFFVFTTKTMDIPHTSLWVSICKKYEPHVRLDVIGSRSDGERWCSPLFVPENLKIERQD